MYADGIWVPARRIGYVSGGAVVTAVVTSGSFVVTGGAVVSPSGLSVQALPELKNKLS